MHTNEYMREYMARRYRARREAALVQLGGTCALCGATENLEFDHVDRTTKRGEISRLFSRGEARYKQELEKCQLLCSSCHRAKSAAEIAVDHGGGLTGKRNCRCPLCGPLKKAYARR